MGERLEERFEAMVDRTRTHHLWTGARDSGKGTGRVKVDGRTVTAHRAAWMLANGSVPTGARVLPCPDEPGCVRVDHLRLSRAEPPSPGRRRAARGGGSRREVRPGTWELAVVVGRDERGRLRRVFRTVYGSDIDAAKALAEFVTEIGDGHALPSPDARGTEVGHLLRDYLAHLERDKGRKHSTLVRYRGLLETWIDPPLGKKRADRVTPADIDSALGRMRRAGQSQSSIHQAFTLLNGAFKWARRNRVVRANPLTDIELPRSKRPPREVMPPDVATVQRLIEEAMAEDFDFGVACHVGAVTGMRRGELAGLQWSRVDLDGRRIKVDRTVNDAGGTVVVDDFTKTRQVRWVGLDGNTVVLLHRLRQLAEERAAAVGKTVPADAFVFTRDPDSSAPMRPEHMTRTMRRLRRRLGLEGGEFDTTLQSLRHWTQTMLNEAGYNPRQIARRGGHSEQLMNRVYVHRTATAEDEMTQYVGELLMSDARGTEDASS